MDNNKRTGNKNSTSGASRRIRRRRRSARSNNLSILRLLILVVVVLLVFEGKLIGRMISQAGGGSIEVVQAGATASSEQTQETQSGTVSSQNGQGEDAETGTADASSSSAAGSDILAGFSSDNGNTETQNTQSTEQAQDTPAPLPSVSVLDYPYVVKEQAESVDDSYFTDAVFIGDSRMEGFRNASGITQGDFMTSVGMSIDTFQNTTVSTSYGSVTVFQGLSGIQYKKIYMMLGANDLGFFPWEDFLPKVTAILEQFHELQPDATIYICSCIYVEEAKVTTSYVNNENVIRVNDYLLEACKNLDYCWYINLNEIFDNGYHSLIEGASQDGVHLYADYLKQMLLYLKSHYI